MGCAGHSVHVLLRARGGAVTFSRTAPGAAMSARGWGGGRRLDEGVRGNEKVLGKGKKRKTSNIRFILEGRILLLTHHTASVAMVTTGNNFCLLSPSLYPLNCVYLYFYSLHLGLTAGDG